MTIVEVVVAHDRLGHRLGIGTLGFVIAVCLTTTTRLMSPGIERHG